MHPDDRATVDAAYTDSVRENRETYEVEHRVVQKDTGAIRIVLERCQHVRNTAGKIVRSIGMVQDITERKSAEEAVRASEEHYRQLFDNMQNGFAHCQMVYDVEDRPVDFIFHTVNTAFGWLTGLQDVVGKQVTELLPGVGAASPELLAACGRVAQTGQPEWLELDFKPLARWFTFSIYCPHPGHFAMVFDDITARKQNEAKLHELSQRLNYHVEHSPLAVIEWGPDRRIDRWAGAAEVLGKQMTDFRWVDGDDEPQLTAVSDELATGQDPHHTAAKRNYRKDGAVIYCEWYNSALRDDTGNPRSILSLVLDVTERRRAEDQVKAALAEKEILLKEIHHRVKNNLQVVASLISLQSDTVTDDKAQAVFDALRDRVHTMALVHEKLYQTEDLARLDFASYAASLLDDLWQSYGVIGKVRLKLLIPPVVLPVKTAMHCALILNELASNALKHAFPSGRSGEVTVALEHDQATGTLCLRVWDNGVGIPTGLDWRNTGSLGMRLVQMLAGGTVEAGPGPGTEFRVTIPLNGAGAGSAHQSG